MAHQRGGCSSPRSFAKAMFAAHRLRFSDLVTSNLGQITMIYFCEFYVLFHFYVIKFSDMKMKKDSISIFRDIVIFK